jgi:hypothetical protein
MISLLFRLFGDASPLRRTFQGVRTDARRAGQEAGAEFNRGMGLGGRMRQGMGFGMGLGRLRGGIGMIAGTLGGGLGARTIGEGARLGNLAQQMGVNVELLQRAELAQKLYGDQVFKSTEALGKAIEKLSGVNVQSAETIRQLQRESEAWGKAFASIKASSGGVVASVSEALRGLLEIGTLPLRWLFKGVIPEGRTGGGASGT